jgi:site-specific DNA recombinase
MAQAAVYVRISEDRAKEEKGVERQEEDSYALAARHGRRDVALYKDNDISASPFAKKNRPAYGRLLNDIKSGQIDFVVSYSSSRLTRNVQEVLDLRTFVLGLDHRVEIQLCVGGELRLYEWQGAMVSTITTAVDQGRSEADSALIRRQHIQRAKAGEHNGEAGYGYELVLDPETGKRHMVVVETEAEIIREIAQRLIDGESQRSIARDLNRRGVPTRRGVKWLPIVIKQIMTSPRIAGMRRHRPDDPKEKERLYPAKWDAIITPETFRLVQRVFERSRQKSASSRRAGQYLLSGLLVCEVCKKRLTHNHTEGNGEFYYCQTGIKVPDSELFCV